MSENLDLVRSLYAAWERGDFSSTEWAHPEIEWIIADGPSPGTWTGVAGMVENFRSLLGAWEDFHGGGAEYRELDHERVLVLDDRSGRGRASGLEVAAKGAVVFRICDGKVTRVVAYWDRDRALADLGLAE
jgi:ketosteroid isomerase-like protein